MTPFQATFRPGRFLCRLAMLLAALAVFPAFAQSVANGENFYMSICRACHGFPPSGGPDRAAGNPAMIQSAINGVGAMRFLRGLLTDSDIRDIAAWLLNPVSTPNPPPPPPPPPAPAVPALDFTDLWWNPEESGWGVNIVQHPSHSVFGVIYTYDAARRASWFVSSDGSWTTPFQYTGDLYRVTGPPFNAPVFDSTRVGVVKVGAFTLDFNSRDSGTLTYTVDGVRVAKPIARQPF